MKLVVTINGQPVEVDIADVTLPEGARILGANETPEGFISKTFMEHELNRRLAANGRTLQSNPDHQKAVLQQFGLELDENGQVKGQKNGGADRDAIVREVSAQYAEKEAVYKNQIDGLRRKSFEAEIIQAAIESGVQDFYCKPMPGANTVPFVVQQAGAFTFDENLNRFVLKDINGNPVPSRNPSAENPYATVKDLFNGWKEDKNYASFFKDDRQQGAGHTPSNQQQGVAKSLNDMSTDEKVAFIRNNGQEAFEKLALGK